jgi:hypothetical protein
MQLGNAAARARDALLARRDSQVSACGVAGLKREICLQQHIVSSSPENAVSCTLEPKTVDKIDVMPEKTSIQANNSSNRRSSTG